MCDKPENTRQVVEAVWHLERGVECVCVGDRKEVSEVSPWSDAPRGGGGDWRRGRGGGVGKVL